MWKFLFSFLFFSRRFAPAAIRRLWASSFPFYARLDQKVPDPICARHVGNERSHPSSAAIFPRYARNSSHGVILKEEERKRKSLFYILPLSFFRFIQQTYFFLLSNGQEKKESKERPGGPFDRSGTGARVLYLAVSRWVSFLLSLSLPAERAELSYWLWRRDESLASPFSTKYPSVAVRWLSRELAV